MRKDSGSAVKNLPTMQEPQEMWIRSLGREDPLEEGLATLLPRESHGQRSLVGYILYGHKELDKTEAI